ncbi:MAG: hypothetical protein RSA91_07800 [Bacilli bacterium]
MEREFLKYKGYAHFDKRMSISKAKKLLANEETINKHGFFPFIHFQIKNKKIEMTETGVHKKKEPKKREIYYASHLDRYIYQKYAFEIGNKYNEYVKKNDISECCVAYRTDLGKCNIDFASEIFKFIRQSENSTIIIGDFTNFFDNLNHTELKKRIQVVIDSNLDNNLYKVFKSITKFKYVDVLDIYKFLGKKRGRRSEKYYLRELKQIMTTSEFRVFIKNSQILKENSKDYGIVQGSSLSGLFANIYMIFFDKEMKELAIKYDGKYMRYSDDFVLVIKNKTTIDIKKIYKKVQHIIINAKNIQLKPEKTNVFQYTNGNIESINKDILNTENIPSIISFLGFSFDGENIKIRDKTITKYNYKMIRKIGRYKNGKNVTLNELFDKFTIQGTTKKRGNFISYIKRAEKVFEGELAISNVRKRSKQKLLTNLSKDRVGNKKES